MSVKKLLVVEALINTPHSRAFIAAPASVARSITRAAGRQAWCARHTRRPQSPPPRGPPPEAAPPAQGTPEAEKCDICVGLCPKTTWQSAFRCLKTMIFVYYDTYYYVYDVYTANERSIERTNVIGGVPRFFFFSTLLRRLRRKQNTPQQLFGLQRPVRVAAVLVVVLRATRRHVFRRLWCC